MSLNATTEVEFLQQRLAFLEHDLLLLRARRRALRAQAFLLPLAFAWGHVAAPFRRASDYAFGWRFAGVPIAAVLSFAVVVVFSSSFELSVLGSVLAASVACAALYAGEDSQLEQLAEGSLIERRAAIKECGSINARILTLKQDHAAVAANREKVIRSEQYRAEQSRLEATQRREHLLQQNWRAMRSVEFEQYLLSVFRELGFAVETTPVSGDQGVDLIVDKHGQRTALQVKGYYSSVSNSAIQEAYAGQRHYGCSRCAVITNSRFTASAVQLAESVECILVDEDTLPALVLGHFEPFR